MKNKTKTLLLLTVGLILLLFTGCTINTTSELSVDDKFQGSRTFHAIADKELLEKFKGTRSELKQKIEDAVPEGLEHELIDTEDQGLELKIVAKFADLDEYKSQMTSMLKAGGIDGDFDANFSVSYGDTFVTDLEYEDNADNHKLLNWLDKLFQDSNKQESLLSYDNRNNLTFKFNGREIDVRSSDNRYIAENIKIYQPNSVDIYLDVLGKDVINGHLLFFLPTNEFNYLEEQETEEHNDEVNGEETFETKSFAAPTIIGEWFDNLHLDGIQFDKLIHFDARQTYPYYLKIDLAGSSDENVSAINTILNTSANIVAEQKDSQDGLLSTEFTITLDGDLSNNAYGERLTKTYIFIPSDAQIDNDNNNAERVAITTPNNLIDSSKNSLLISGDEAEIKYKSNFPLEEIGITDEVGNSYAVKRNIDFYIDGSLLDTFNTQITPKLKDLGASVETYSIEGSKDAAIENTQTTTTAVDTKDEAESNTSQVDNTSDHDQVVVKATFDSLDISALNDLTSKILPLKTQTFAMSSGLFTYENIVYHQLQTTGNIAKIPIHFSVSCPHLSKIHNVPIASLNSLTSDDRILTNDLNELLAEISGLPNSPITLEYLSSLASNPSERAFLRNIHQLINIWTSDENNGRLEGSPAFSRAFFNLLSPDNIFTVNELGQYETWQPTENYRIENISARNFESTLIPNGSNSSFVYFVRGYKLTPLIVLAVILILLILGIVLLIRYLLKRRKMNYSQKKTKKQPTNYPQSTQHHFYTDNRRGPINPYAQAPQQARPNNPYVYPTSQTNSVPQVNPSLPTNHLPPNKQMPSQQQVYGQNQPPQQDQGIPMNPYMYNNGDIAQQLAPENWPERNN